MKYVPFLFKNVFRKRTRSILTIISIVIPLILICLLGSLVRVVDRPDPAETRGMFRLVTRNKVGVTNAIPENYVDKIAEMDGVLAVTDFTWFGGTYIDDSTKNFFSRGAVRAESFLEVFDDASIVKGSKEDWISDVSGCIVGEDLIKKFGWRIGDKIVLVGNIYPVTLQLTIRGVFRAYSGNSDALFFNRRYLEESLPAFKGRAGTIWTKARDSESATRLATQIDELFENSPYPTKTESEKAFQMGIMSMLGNVKLLITSMGVIIVLVVILISANTIAISARERIREIAVLRTIGFTRLMILSIILGESLIMSLIGGIIGVAAFVFTFNPLKSFLATTPMGNLANALTLYPEIVVLGIIVSIAVGLLSAIVPAIGASRRSIKEGLRYVG
jgi:putative ABC transport system permease protein